MKKSKISLSDIEAFVFDFDGVLTNNLVHLNQDGQVNVMDIIILVGMIIGL